MLAFGGRVWRKPTIVVALTLNSGKSTVSKGDPVPALAEVTCMLGTQITIKSRN